MSSELKSSRGVLGPAALRACADASVLAVPAAGAMVCTVLQHLSKAFMLKKWFHGAMSAVEAEQLMMERGKNGSYLVRESKSRPGDLVLSVRVRGRVSHVIIRKQHKMYETGSGEQFSDLSELIAHHRVHPIVESSGDVLRLLQPVPSGLGAWVRPSRKQEPLAALQAQIQEEDSLLLDRELYQRELDELQEQLDQLDSLTTDEGLKPANRRKNRYSNVLPYDRTRVVLKDKTHPAEEEGADYINASYIKFDDSCLDTSATSAESSSKSKCNGKTYIATQGCLPATEDDFYHMLWQEDVKIVVMLTKQFERNKWKCSEYWPSVDREKKLECFSLQLVSEATHPHCVRRVIRVTRDADVKLITQYQFVTWPDHRTPHEVEPVLALVRDVNEELDKYSEKGINTKLCVHCSAGMGRTGTFIVLDHILQQIREKGKEHQPSIADAVKQARRQRGGMVNNLAQYAFIHRAVQAYRQRHAADS